MKKIYLTICMGAFLIIPSVFLFPLTANSQDITEAQKQERCKNNKNRITELETQLRVTDAELSQIMEPKEIEDARTQMVLVRNTKNTRILLGSDWSKFESIAAFYHYDLNGCMKFNENQSNKLVVCLKELEVIIANKIDKGVSLQNKRPGLINKKNEINKQLTAYRNNLLKWGCDSRTWRLTTVLPPGDKYAGSYSVDINMTQRDGQLTGSGTWSNGANSNFTGSISGGGVTLHRVDVSGFKAEFWGKISADGSMEGTGKNDPSSPGGNNSTYTWTLKRL